jgi:hypothetical protein
MYSNPRLIRIVIEDIEDYLQQCQSMTGDRQFWVVRYVFVYLFIFFFLPSKITGRIQIANSR